MDLSSNSDLQFKLNSNEGKEQSVECHIFVEVDHGELGWLDLSILISCPPTVNILQFYKPKRNSQI